MLKKAFSFRSQKPPLRVRQDSSAGQAKEGAKSYAKAEKFKKSEKGGSILCNFRYGAAAMQGFRPHMQDDFTCSPSESVRGSSFGFFAVFDGHGRHGDIVSRYCTENFLNELLNRKIVKSCKSLTMDILASALKKTCVKFDEQLKEASRTYVNPAAGEDGRISFVFSGTTATMALVLDKHIIVCNAGDSRTILCGSGGIRFSTVDHNPGNKVEDKRIVAAGGKIHTTPSKNKVILDPEAYTNLAVSRTLGDYGFKKSPNLSVDEQIVSPVPDVEVIEREFTTDEFLLLASDGIFKSMSSTDAVVFVQQRMMVTDDLATICRELIEMAYFSPEITPDDTTVIIVKFSAAPTVSHTAKCEDQVLTAQAFRIIQGEVDKIVDGAEDKWVLENEYNIIQRLAGKLPTKYLVQLRAEYISKLIAEGRDRRFGDEIDGSSELNKTKLQVSDEAEKKEEESSEVEAKPTVKESETVVVLDFAGPESSESAANMESKCDAGISEHLRENNNHSTVSRLSLKSVKTNNPSPLLAELGKAMLKRKMSEPKFTPVENSSALNGATSSSKVNSGAFTENSKSESAKENSSSDTTEKVSDTEITNAEKSALGKDERDPNKMISDEAASRLDIKSTETDPTAAKIDLIKEKTLLNEEDQSAVTVCIDVVSDKADKKDFNSTENKERYSKAISEGCYSLGSDIDTGLDYMYDSDEKTTEL